MELENNEVPLIIFPKRCTKLEMNCDLSDNDNVYIKLAIISPDTEGNQTCIYSGFCNVKLMESANRPIYVYPVAEASETVEVEPENCPSSDDISQMPIIFSDSNFPTQTYNESQVWIDPTRSPFVYNHYVGPAQQTYSIPAQETHSIPAEQTYSVPENAGCITVQQHNTFITQNVYNYDRPLKKPKRNTSKRPKEAPVQLQSPEILYEDEESESEMFLSQLSKKKKQNKGDKTSNVQQKNEALKQLMATNTPSTSKQRKTILFQGKDSKAGQTIQNILYTDPKVKCSAVDLERDFLYGEPSTSTPHKKKYQCAKCKQIFGQLSIFRQHMVGNHANYLPANKTNQYICSECGRKFSNQFKYHTHCMGHGDPDLECPKCHKVYASKNSLKIHSKIHNRKYRCSYCTRSYDNPNFYKMHLKGHSVFVCQYKDCFFMANSALTRDDHYIDHIQDYRVNSDHSDNYYDHVEEFNAVNDRNQNNDESNADFDEQINNNYDDQIDEHFGISKTSNDNGLEESFLDFSETFDDDFIVTECGLVLKTELSVEQETVLLTSSDKNTLDWSTENAKAHEKQEKKNKNKRVGRDNGEKNNKNVREEKSVNKEEKINENAKQKSGIKNDGVKKAESVIAKVMSDKLFLLNTKKKNDRYVRYNKTCQVCSKTFDRVGDLKRHLIEHVIKSTLAKAVSSDQGILQINCEICQTESFNSLDKYKAHLREHAKLTLYKCTFCDKSFSDSSNFSKHKKIHGDSYFQCDMCRRKFNSKAMLSKHLELHAKNKPLKCKHCHRMFPFESTLKKHVKSVHSNPSKNKYHCRFCSVICKSLKEKWDHEWEIHGIRKMVVDCFVCKAKFRKFSELKKHCSDEHQMDVPTRREVQNALRSEKRVRVQRNQ